MESERIINKGQFSRLEQLAIIIYILAEINADIFANRVVYACCTLFLLVTLRMNTSYHARWNMYVKWSILWVSVVALSFLYSVSPSYTKMSIIIVFLRSVIMYTFLSRIHSATAIVQIMYLTIFASFVNSVYMLSMVNLAELGEERLGRGTIDEHWNANAIGMELTFNVFFIFYLFQNNYVKVKAMRLYLLSCSLLFIFVILMTGSRKAFFLLLLPILLYYMIEGKKKSALNKIVMIITGLFLTYFIIMSIDPVYNVLGVRLERLFASLGGSIEDGSISSRRALRVMGLRWFEERPLFGYGMNTFEPMCGQATGRYWYSHNNYIEIMVGTGLLGLITYYSFYIWILVKSVKKRYSEYAVGIALLLPILLNEVGLVSYKTFIIQFILMLVTAHILLRRA